MKRNRIKFISTSPIQRSTRSVQQPWVQVIDALEKRILFHPKTIDIGDGYTPLPLGNTKPGQEVPLTVDYQDADRGDPAELEDEDVFVTIQGSSGYEMTVHGAGEHTIKFPIHKKGETLRAFLSDSVKDDGPATITIGDRVVQVKVDLAAFSAGWLDIADKIAKTEA